MELGIDGSALDAREREPPGATATNATELIAQLHALSELSVADDRVLCQESARFGEQPEAAAPATVDGPRCRLISDVARRDLTEVGTVPVRKRARSEREPLMMPLRNFALS